MDPLTRALLWLVGVCALLGGTWWHGHRAGAESERQACAVAAAEVQRQADARRDESRAVAETAAADFEARRAVLARQAAEAKAALRTALARPICPAPGGDPDATPATLADLRIPAAAVQRLRDAAGQAADH